MIRILLSLLVLTGISLIVPAESAESPFFIVPRPLKAMPSGEVFSFEATVSIVTSDGPASAIAAELADTLRKATGLPIPVEMNAPGHGKKPICLALTKNDELGDEGYSLIITAQRVDLTANQPAGLFYGMQTICQLLPLEGDIKTLPGGDILDIPRFSWRGVHLDVGRHFFDKAFVKKYIDMMAAYKMNRFHWHLTEDQGWRIEIKKYPKLTEVGGFRSGTVIGHLHDKPRQFDNKRYGGFYTQEDIREVVDYAAKRFVTIVPEIEMPGHSLAALAAYPEYSCTGGPFEPARLWGVFPDVFCAGKEETFRFMEDILDEVVALFPGPYVHIGGDECPKDRWKECPDCQARIQAEGLKNEHELQSYFIHRIEQYLLTKNRRLIGWDEILEGGLAPQATVMSWRGMTGGIEAANAGHDVIMTPTDFCYFDYYQSARRDEEPLAIGGLLTLEKVYGFDPIPPKIADDKRHHILGGQANLWTEYMKTPEHVEYMLFPRLCALSEVVWTEASQRDYDDFTRRMQNHYPRLKARGIHFRPEK